MSHQEILQQRVELFCLKQRRNESNRRYYQRVKTIRDNYRRLVQISLTENERNLEKFKEIFEISLTTEEYAVIGYVLGAKEGIRKYLQLPCEYRNIDDVAQHIQMIEKRTRRLRFSSLTKETLAEFVAGEKERETNEK